MIFPIITLITSLLLAAVAGWFSITGMVTILAGQAIAALILGVTLEAGKLVTISWLYRNWRISSWKLKIPLIYFTVALMSITSMGVYGYLAQAHIQQGASTVNNAARVEQIALQITRAQSLMADNDRVISQLDTAVNSLIAKDRTDRALAVKRTQDSQRRSLKADSDKIQTQINQLNDEKFKLESEVRSLQLEVGPIRYIAQLIYGEGSDDTRTLEAAVRLFAILIVTTLDPLAITLLIAANQSLLMARRKELDTTQEVQPTVVPQSPPDDQVSSDIQEETVESPPEPIITDTVLEVDGVLDTEDPEYHYELPPSETTLDQDWEEYHQREDGKYVQPPKPLEDSLVGVHATEEPREHDVGPSQFCDEDFGLSELVPSPSHDQTVTAPWLIQADSLRELLGDDPHFVAKKVVSEPQDERIIAEDKYPRPHSWIAEFKRKQ